MKTGNIFCKISSLDNKTIDKVGISKSIKTCLGKALDGLEVRPTEVKVLLDGGLRAPEKYIYQETIIKGDEKEAVIAMASVMAKVVRDRQLEALDPKYPQYGFAKHKGYGTKEHLQAIGKFGLCDLHRRSFCKNFV